MEAAKVIADLGGPTKAAAALSEFTGREFTQPQVSNWLSRGVPWQWRQTIERLLAARAANPSERSQDERGAAA